MLYKYRIFIDSLVIIHRDFLTMTYRKQGSYNNFTFITFAKITILIVKRLYMRGIFFFEIGTIHLKLMFYELVNVLEKLWERAPCIYIHGCSVIIRHSIKSLLLILLIIYSIWLLVASAENLLQNSVSVSLQRIKDWIIQYLYL